MSEFASLEGIGGLIASGRWNSVGRPVVYMAEASSLAMLEVLAGYDVARPSETFQLMEIDTGDVAAIAEWPLDQDHYDTTLTIPWGDAFLRAGKNALARVPSALAPHSWNWLLNPMHPDAASVRIARTERWPWDVRLFGRAEPG